MPILTVAALSAAMLLQTPGNEASMIIRPSDSDMTCEALAAEVNELSAQLRERQQRAETARTAGRVGRGLLSGLARGANMFGYGSSEGAMAAVAVTAAAGAADQMAASPGATAPAATVEQQRIEHLTGLRASRSC